jgi:threonine/homoserine/homoserine lactone efflux protein
MDALPGFILAGFALAGSPGPNTLSLTATGAAFGARRGLLYMAGMNIGMVVVMGLVASGVTGLILAIPGATPVVTALAALYFLYLAWCIASAPPLSDATVPRQPPSFVGGFLLSLVNPKGYAAMAALFSGFVLVQGAVGVDIALKIAVLAAVITAVNIAWLFAGAALTGLFRNKRSNRIINISFAVLLLASLVVALRA